MIVAQIMAFYITNGMTVRQVACQLGITHATVYSKLRKTGLMKPPSQSEAILNPTVGDFRQGGGLGTEFIVIQKTNEYRNPKKCVTPISAGESDPGDSPGCSPGPGSNAER